MPPPLKKESPELDFAPVGAKITNPNELVLTKTIKTNQGNRIMLYGTGGLGKTTLCSYAPGDVVFFDLDKSLSKLDLENEPMIVACESWIDIRSNLKKQWPKSVKTIVIDSVTVAEEMCIRHLLDTVKTFEKPPEKANTLEDYGFGKDVRLVYEMFIPLLDDLQKHFNEGRNVILIAHECTPQVTNTSGADWIRAEPRLRTSKKGENSIRLKVKEWSDFVVYYAYDVAVNKDKKGQGHGSRQLYLSELPAYMAKNRGCEGPIAVEKGSEVEVWKQIIK
jgi:hypothetical protein